MEHRQGVIKTLQHRAKEVPTTTEGVKKELKHLKTTLRIRGYPDWAFSKTSRKRDPKKEENRNKHQWHSMPHLARVSEKFRRSPQKHDIPVQFKPSNTLRDWSTARTKHQDTNRYKPAALSQDKIQQDTPLKTARCVYWQEKGSRKPLTSS